MDVIHAAQLVEDRAARPKYQFYRRRIPADWNKLHPERQYAALDDLLKDEGDAAIEFFIELLKTSNYRAESRRSYLNALKQLGREYFSQAALNDLESILRRMSQMIQENEEENKLNEFEDAKWIPWDTVLDLYDKLVDRMFTPPGLDYEGWQCYLLFSLYVLNPPLRHN
jgi:hypothetical protein